MKKAFKFGFLAIMTLGVMAMYSYKWAIPTLSSKTQKDYLPIYYGPGTESDDYFYYSRIREVMDGNWVHGDHATYEHKKVPTPHASYSVSFIIGAIGGMFSNKIQYAYYFNHLVFPILTMLGLFFLGMQFGLSWPFAIFAVSEIMVRVGSLWRTPNTLITGVPLIFLTLVCFMKFAKGNPSRWLDVALILLLGTSSLVSIPNFFLSYFIFAFLFIFYWNQAINRKGFFKIFILSLFFAAPGIYLILQSLLSNSEDWINLAIPPISQYRGWHWNQIKPILQMGSHVAVLAAMIFVFPYKRFSIAVLLGITSCYVAVLAMRGSYVGAYIFNRGGESVYYFVLTVTFLLILSKLLKNKKRLGLFFSVLALGIAVNDLGRANVSKWNRAKKAQSAFQFGEFKELVGWTLENVKSPAVVVSTDFSLVTNIGVYTPFDTYLAFAHHSPVATEERWKRYIESLQFMGQGPEFLKNRLRTMVSHAGMPADAEETIDLGLMQLIMFYGMYMDKAMEPEAIDNILLQFPNDFPAVFRLSYRADYFILTELTRQQVVAGSPADFVIRNSQPVFENRKYSVYRLKY